MRVFRIQPIGYSSERPRKHRLHDAISSGKLSLVKFLLEKNVYNVNERNSNGDTPLHVAVRQLCYLNTSVWADVVADLIKRGASIASQNNAGNTPVHLGFLLESSTGEVVDVLLQHYVRALRFRIPSSNVNEDGLGIFHIACTRSNVKVLRTLADYGFYENPSQVSLVSKCGYAGLTPLHFAVISGQREVIELLIDSEADIYATDKNGSTALHLALQLRSEEMIALLVPHYQCDMIDALGYSHFMAVCTNGNVSFVRNYLEAAADTFPTLSSIILKIQVQNTKDIPFAGYTPLHFAVECGSHEIVAALLKRDPDYSTPDINGTTALHLALYRRDQALIESILLANEVFGDVVDVFGLSHFMAACAANRPDIVKELVRVNKAQSLLTLINVKVRNDSHFFAGYTPLHFAVEFRNHATAKLLLDAQADVYAQNINGSTPLHLALASCDFKMVDLIFKYDKRYTNVTNNSGLTHFMVACAGSDSSVVQQFLSRHKPALSMVNQQVQDDPSFAGYSPLHFASELGRIETVKCLLAANADCCSRTSQKITPIMFTEKNGDIWRLLRQHCNSYKNFDNSTLTRVFYGGNTDDNVYACDVDEGLDDICRNQMNSNDFME